MSVFKRFILVLVFLFLGVWGVRAAYYSMTAGFSIVNISSEHKDDPRWDIPALTLAEADEVKQALSQEYTYLGKGHQSYVFESQDKRYVLKFLKFQKYRHHPVITWLPIPSVFTKKLRRQAIHKAEKRDALFKSWKIAYTKLKDQTQVFFIHINRNQPFEHELTLYNKSGQPYQLNLNDFVFLLQRKTALLEDVLKSKMTAGNVVEAKLLLDGLFDLYVEEYNQGIYEEDRYIVRNTGVLNNKPIQIDTGRLRENKAFLDPKRQSKEIVWKTSILKSWLETHYPELAKYFNERLRVYENVANS